MEIEHNSDHVLDDDDNEEEDALSFCDFPIQKPETNYYSHDDDELFEFRIDQNQKTRVATNEIVFCGKVIESMNLRLRGDEDRASKTIPNFLSKSESFLPNQSFRFGSSSRPFSSAENGNYEFLRNNSVSRRPRVLIGLAKTPTRMELSEIRRRQARRAPVPMFTAVVGEESAVSDSSGGGMWSVMRAFRYRSIVVRALTKAASGCIPHV